MKAMVLAAGRGDRLRPLTDRCPKPLIKVAGKELMAYHLEKLRAAGITDILVNSAWLHQQIVDFLGDGSRFGVHITHSVEGETGLETAGGIIRALPFFEGRPFLVVNGDTFIDNDYSAFLNYTLKEGENAHLYLIKNPPHNLKGDFSITPDGHLAFGGDYTFSGTAIYRPQPFEGYEVQKLPLLNFFKEWIGQGTASAQFADLKWFDVGTVERLAELEQYLKNKGQEGT